MERGHCNWVFVTVSEPGENTKATELHILKVNFLIHELYLNLNILNMKRRGEARLGWVALKV